MIVLASYCLNFLHPGYLLADVIEAERKAKSVEKMRKKGLKKNMRQNYANELHKSRHKA